MEECSEVRIHVWTYERMDVRSGGRTDGRAYGRIDGRTDERTDESAYG